MWNIGLDESQAEIKISERNVKKPQICRWCHFSGMKLRGTKQPIDEGERGEWKKLVWNIDKTKIMASGPTT